MGEWHLREIVIQFTFPTAYISNIFSNMQEIHPHATITSMGEMTPLEASPNGRTGQGWPRLALLIALVVALAGGCGLFDFFSDDPKTAEEEKAAKDPFTQGMLKAIANLAPPKSNSQYLAGIADQMGWEQALSRNKLLRKAVEEEEFEEKVEPYLISLFYRNGYSVMPQLGEGHQIARDTLVRGGVGTDRYLIMTREPVRIIFLGPVRGVQLIYPRDGTPPQVFTRDEQGTIAVRASLVKDQLR